MRISAFKCIYIMIGFGLFACKSVPTDEKRTNILFAIADDASWKHFGAYGCDWVKTPAFDKVANNGILFPRIKGQVYEYSNHLPLAIMWPNGIKRPGRTVDDLVNFIDFTPTYLEFAGLTAQDVGMQAITGKSLTDIFNFEKEGIVNPTRDFILVGKEQHDVGRPDDQGYPVRGIIKEGFLYLQNFKPDRWPKGNPETGYLNCDGSPTKSYILDTRSKKNQMKFWQLNFGKRVAEELYNIVNDPYCMVILIEGETYSVKKIQLSEEMKEKLTKQEDPRILGIGDIFDNYPYSGAVKNYYNHYMAGEKVPAGWVNISDFDHYLIDKEYAS